MITATGKLSRTIHHTRTRKEDGTLREVALPEHALEILELFGREILPSEHMSC